MEFNELKTELERIHVASFGWALSCCQRNHAEAEDVLQSVYLKILAGKARYRGESNFKTWLFAVIRKTALSERRANFRRTLRSMVGGSRLNESARLPVEPGALLEQSETQAQFLQALDKLPQRQREVLHLLFYEDLSLREAATVMRVTIGSTRRHYDRGKKRLRELLEDEEGNYGVHWRRTENPSAIL
jgi:RNA polymerase sigma-70 factor (ECF subfamily)